SQTGGEERLESRFCRTSESSEEGRVRCAGLYCVCGVVSVGCFTLQRVGNGF
ncbi:unnamed protein product, partial [Amoebophrya sp. A25]